jgi:hypothetical protein
MRQDEEGNSVPATLGEYRKLCAMMGGENCRAVQFLDERIAEAGENEAVVVSDLQMRQLLLPMLVQPKKAEGPRGPSKNWRQEVLQQFEVKEGRICSPGRFEGEMLYVPYFWEKGVDGWQDEEEEDGTLVFFVMPEDSTQFPELRSKTEVRLYQRDDGFICEKN